jgi:hypothetical protein
MRAVHSSLAVLLLSAGPLAAQPLDVKVLKLSDKGELLITKTVAEQVTVTQTVLVPVQMQVIENGKAVTVTKHVKQTRQSVKTAFTTGFTPLADFDAAFSDLKGDPVALADVKKRVEKNACAVIALQKDDAPLSAVILAAFKEDTLIVRIAPLFKPAPKAIKAAN